MHIIQSKRNLFQNRLSCLHRKGRIIFYQGKQIALEVLVNKYIGLSIFVDVVAEAMVIAEIVFELLQVIKD
jgi:hypothetical protein